MARPKEFERETVLKKAIKIFADHGYEGTSTEALMRGMGISRQSMYDTFGDKRRLYLAALQYYNAESVTDILQNLNSSGSPLKGIAATLLAFATQTRHGAPIGCLGVSAVCEFGRSDPEVSLITDSLGRIVLSAFERLLGEAKKAGEIGRELDVAAAAQFLMATISGMKVAARSGVDAETLRDIARMALRSLR